MTTKFIVVTVFPNMRKMGIRVDKIAGVREEPDGRAALIADNNERATLFCAESFSSVVAQLTDTDHVD